MSPTARRLAAALRRSAASSAKAHKLSQMGLPESAERARADAWLARCDARQFAQKLIAGPSL